MHDHRVDVGRLPERDLRLGIAAAVGDMVDREAGRIPF
jgi:hypothetical protein